MELMPGKEQLGRNIVFAYCPLQDPLFVSRGIDVPVVFRITAKCKGCVDGLRISIVLACARGVVFGNKRDAWVGELSLENDAIEEFYIVFKPKELTPPKFVLATCVVKYLDGDGKELFNETYTVEVSIVGSPALVGVKNSQVFNGVKEIK